MNKTSKVGLGIAASCAVLAIIPVVVLTTAKVQYGSVGDGGDPWYLALWSLLTGGAAFSLPALFQFVWSWIQRLKGTSTIPSVTIPPESATVPEVVELIRAIIAFAQDRTSKTLQRNLFFALADVADVIPGLETSHDNGVIVLRYNGFQTVAKHKPTVMEVRTYLSDTRKPGPAHPDTPSGIVESVTAPNVPPPAPVSVTLP